MCVSHDLQSKLPRESISKVTLASDKLGRVGLLFKLFDEHLLNALKLFSLLLFDTFLLFLSQWFALSGVFRVTIIAAHYVEKGK